MDLGRSGAQGLSSMPFPGTTLNLTFNIINILAD